MNELLILFGYMVVMIPVLALVMFIENKLNEKP